MPRIYITPLKHFLLELDLTQAALAKELGASPPRISAFVNGESVPSLQLAEKMTEFFKSKGFTEINELVFLYPERYTPSIDLPTPFQKQD
ncbi:MAG: helix-turn-helix transcriptional regulator [Neisseria animaloris]|nr:helix-turn-helix transcriptional regulator [Neisseria animaloris]